MSVLIVLLLFSQTWENLYNLNVYLISGAIVTNDSCFVVASGSYGGLPIIKLDRYGNLIWQKRIGGGYWESNRIIQTQNGNLVICGTRDLGPILMAVTMINSQNGDTVWTRVFQPETTIQVWGIGASQTTDGKILAIGTTFSYKVYIVKLDTFGNLEWQRMYPSAEEDLGYDVLEVDNYYLILANKNLRPWIIKINPTNGEIIEQRIYEFPQIGTQSFAIRMTRTSDNGYFLGGNVRLNSNPHGYAYFAIKLNSFLNVQWARGYKLGNNDNFVVKGWESENGYWIAGTINETWYAPGPQRICLLRLNSQGESLYSRQYWTSYYGTRCKDSDKTWDGGIITLGSLCNPAGNPYVYVVRTNNVGLIGIEEVSEKLKLQTKIFPNPSSASKFLKDNNSLRIFQVDGKTSSPSRSGIYFAIDKNNKYKIVILRP